MTEKLQNCNECTILLFNGTACVKYKQVTEYAPFTPNEPPDRAQDVCEDLALDSVAV